MFCVGVVLGLWAAGCAARWLPDDRPTTATVRFDGLGALLYGPSLAALMLGFTGLERPGGALLLGLGVLGLGAFAWWELRTPQPLLEVRLLVTNRAFALSNLAALINLRHRG